MQATTKSKQSEAKQLLKQIYTMQRTYRQDPQHPNYGDNGVTAAAGGSFPQIGVDIMATAQYSYTMTAAADAFTCVATANLDDDGTIDTWQIDEAGDLQVTTDDVAG